jgi:hypothetical protein
LIINQNETEKNEIIEKMKEENKNELKKIIDYEEDDILFYSEKLEKEQDIKKSSKWLNDINDEEIDTNFNNMIEYRKDNKSLDNNNYFYYDLNYSISEYVTESIFDDIPQGGGNMYSKFSLYLSEKSFKTYMKKMNYNYLILMLLSFFDFEKESNNYYEILDETHVLIIFLKKMLLNAGLSTSKIYDSVIHVASSKKGHITFEDYLSCFLPIFDLSVKFQCFKYKFLLFLVKKNDKDVITLNNYRLFCNLIRGKLIYDSATCNNVISKLLPILKAKYPKDDPENLNFQHVNIILEFIVNIDID